MTEEQIVRLWSKVKKGDDNQCWLWIGAFDQDGYGTMSVNNRQRRAHRLALIASGHQLPAGLVVDHRCRNRACVNPKHLRVVTRAVNVHENSEALAHTNSLKTHCVKGHLLDGENLFIRPSGRRGCRVCRREHNRISYAKSNQGVRYE